MFSTNEVVCSISFGEHDYQSSVLDNRFHVPKSIGCFWKYVSNIKHSFQNDIKMFVQLLELISLQQLRNVVTCSVVTYGVVRM
jgi:hypothetical protein